MVRQLWLAVLLMGAGVAATAAGAERPAAPAAACYSGAYLLSDGTRMVFSPSGEKKLRYRLMDGRSGVMAPAAATSTAGAASRAVEFHSTPGWSGREPEVASVARFPSCSAGTVTFQWVTAPALSGKRIPQPVIPARFASGSDVELFGELHLPAASKPRTVIVLQFGSGYESAVLNNYVQHLLPLKDLAVFVFDKRGTGQSTGKLTMDFGTLSDDMAAAVRQVRTMRQVAGVPVGLMGESQGGWVVPLTASKVPVDFTIVSYGLAISPQEENRQEMLGVLHTRGYDKDPTVAAHAREVLAATERVMFSRFAEGLDELSRLRAAYGKEQWYKDLGGDYTDVLANASEAEILAIKAYFDFPYDLQYDPLPALRALKVPSLWVVAGKDTEAPSAATLAVLRQVQSEGVPIDVAVFPNADHGIYEVVDTPEGVQDLDRHSAGYFDLLGDWAVRRELHGSFGSAVLTPRKAGGAR